MIEKQCPVCILRQPKVIRSLNLPTINRSVIYKGKTWDVGQVVKVGFLGGTNYEQNFVKEVYKEMNFLNLEFEFIDNKHYTDVRWSFLKGKGSWSYQGTDAQYIPKTEPTVNIGWDVAFDVVRHELGHSIGLAHEHQNPVGGIKWDRERVIKDLMGPPNYWDLATIEHNVLNPLSTVKVDNTEFDPDSVMLYFFPDYWTLDGRGTKANSDWSNLDKEMLKRYYPGVESPIVIEDTVTFLQKIFPTENRLDRLTEWQLLLLADKLGVVADLDDLKRDTISKIHTKLS